MRSLAAHEKGLGASAALMGARSEAASQSRRLGGSVAGWLRPELGPGLVVIV